MFFVYLFGVWAWVKQERHSTVYQSQVLSAECCPGDTSRLLRRDCGEESVAQPGIEKPRRLMASEIVQNLWLYDIDASPVWIMGYHSYWHAFWGVKDSRIENHFPDSSRKEIKHWELPMSYLFSGCGQFGFISQDTQDGTEAAELNFVWCHCAEVGRSMRNLGASSEQGSGTPPNWNSTSTRSVDNSWCHKRYKCPQSGLSCQILAPIPLQGSDKTMLWFACQLGMGIVKTQGSIGAPGNLTMLGC